MATLLSEKPNSAISWRMSLTARTAAVSLAVPLGTAMTSLLLPASEARYRSRNEATCDFCPGVSPREPLAMFVDMVAGFSDTMMGWRWVGSMMVQPARWRPG